MSAKARGQQYFRADTSERLIFVVKLAFQDLVHSYENFETNIPVQLCLEQLPSGDSIGPVADIFKSLRVRQQSTNTYFWT